MNPLFKQYGNKGQNARINPAQSLLQHIQSFKGNPIEILQGKINSGEISQNQYSEMYEIAQGIAQKMAAVLPRK